jgi:predicted amidohydrolase YtcJ
VQDALVVRDSKVLFVGKGKEAEEYAKVSRVEGE